MSHIHLILLLLFISLLGDLAAIFVFTPVCLAALRSRQILPIIILATVGITRLWMDWYFASILIAYYWHLHLGPRYSITLASVAAAIPWVAVFMWLLWGPTIRRGKT